MSNDLFKNAIALTGGISTGKSTVCNLFKLHGFLTIDADVIAHRLLDENSNKIAAMFGEQYVQNGKVLRKELGKIIFSNEENKLKLEALLHPLIKEQIIKESKIMRDVVLEDDENVMRFIGFFNQENELIDWYINKNNP